MRHRTPMPDLRRVDDIAAKCGGVLTRADLAAAGLTTAQLRTSVRRGDLIRLHHGVYALGRRWPATLEQQFAMRCRGLLLLCPPGAVFSHTTAAALHKLALLHRHPVDVFHVTVPHGVNVTRMTGCRLHRARAPLKTVVSAGLPLTTLSRTVLDVARLGDLRSGVVCADSALARRRDLDLQTELLRCYGWPGYRCAARVVSLADGRAESPLESLARLVWREAGLPEPVLQASIHVGGSFLGRVDFLWRKQRVIVEVDGLAKYAEPGELAREKQRQNRLLLAGYVVLRFTWADIVNRPHECAATVHRALASAEVRPTA